MKAPCCSNLHYRGFWRDPQYLEYLGRLRSFDNWTGEPISKRDYAHNGFYVIKRETPSIYQTVKCIGCNLTINVRSIDDPEWLHFKYAPHCEFAPISSNTRFLYNGLEKLKIDDTCADECKR